MTIDVSGGFIDPLWAAEFRGYFFGDGYLGIVRNGRSKGTGLSSSTARAQITTRDDDAAMLYDISSRLGGSLSFTVATGGRVHCPVAIWRTRNAADVLRVCDVLDGGMMPSKKIAEIAVVRRYLSIKIPPGPSTALTLTLRQERDLLIDEIQRLHSYRKLATGR